MKIVFVLPAFLLWFSEPSASTECPSCPAGTFFKEECSCLPCPEKQFRSENNHFKEACEDCTIFEENHHGNILIHPCNATHDIETGCEEGYYRQPHDRFSQECTRCSLCSRKGEFTGRPCTNDTDTICCPQEGMVVVADTKTGLPNCFLPGTEKPEKNTHIPESSPKDKTQISEKTDEPPPEKEKEIDKPTTQSPTTSTSTKVQCLPPEELTCDSDQYFNRVLCACETCLLECSNPPRETFYNLRAYFYGMIQTLMVACTFYMIYFFWFKQRICHNCRECYDPPRLLSEKPSPPDVSTVKETGNEQSQALIQSK